MANNHGIDYGRQGLADSLAAADASGFPVVGIGGAAAAAYRPFVTGERSAIAVFVRRR